MAMAAVRSAARRLAGQQQQAILRSAVGSEHGVLNRGGAPAYALRRFTSSEPFAANAPKISSEHTSVSVDSRLMAAHQKKEELFDLLAEIQMNKDITFTRRMKDRLVLQHLTKHVDRPNNPEWHWYRREYKVHNFLFGTTIVLSFLFMKGVWRGVFFARISKFRELTVTTKPVSPMQKQTLKNSLCRLM